MIVRAVRRDSDPVVDPYAAAGYGLATSAGSSGEWMAIVADGWRLPIVVSGPSEAREAASPYGYAGLSIDRDLDATRVEELWSGSKALLAELGVVSLFVRFPPFAPEQAQRARQLGGLEVSPVSETVLVSTPDAEAIWRSFAGRARTSIRKAEREGLRAGVEPYAAADPKDRHAFRLLYDSTMERLDAPAHLRFEDAYYATLADALGDRLLLATVRDGDTVVAACLLMSDGRTLHYHLSGSDPAGARRGANNLMIWAALREAAQSGLAAMHLGGGTRANDSLFRFKASFGGAVVPFHVGRAVIDEHRYAGLVVQRARSLEVAPEALYESGYFPAFRATPATKENA